jgi:hypothetical protein
MNIPFISLTKDTMITSLEHLQSKTGFITRIKENASYEVPQNSLIQKTFTAVFYRMQLLKLIRKCENKLKLRKIKYYDGEHKKRTLSLLQFI